MNALLNNHCAMMKHEQEVGLLQRSASGRGEFFEDATDCNDVHRSSNCDAVKRMPTSTACQIHEKTHSTQAMAVSSKSAVRIYSMSFRISLELLSESSLSQMRPVRWIS